jgi:citrate/tricarballylate utilization protein
MGESGADVARPFAWTEALAAAFSLKYLSGESDGHGAGCSTTDLRRSHGRRHAHHVTFYGFLLCFAATVTGTIYHYGFGWHAPYAFASLPVVLGTLGGIGLLVGPPLLYVERRRADQVLFDKAQEGMANALIVLLFLSGLTGLLLLAFRSTPAMATLLLVHLAVVMTLFLTFPYGKFVHGFYRLLALVKYALEGRRPVTIIGGETG